jgi:hypothetical protein
VVGLHANSVSVSGSVAYFGMVTVG